MPPLRIETFHEWGWAGGLLVTFASFILQSSIPASVGPNQHMATQILVFTVTQCVIHASSCAQLFIHTTHSLVLPLPLSSLLSVCLSFFFSRANLECEMTPRHVWASIQEDILFLSVQYVHFYFLVFLGFFFLVS